MMPARKHQTLEPAPTFVRQKAGATSFDGLLRSVVGDAVREAVADAMVEVGPNEPVPALIDRRLLSQRLSISESVLDRLRREPEFPTVWVTPEAPRFEIDAVVAWLRIRSTKGQG